MLALFIPEPLLMPEIVAEPPSLCCYHLLSKPESRNINDLILIRFSLARDTREGCAKQSSANPSGWQPGIPNPCAPCPPGAQSEDAALYSVARIGFIPLRALNEEDAW
jgi:hypothetical protein